MGSDFDFLICKENLEVVQDIKQADNHTDRLLLVYDDQTKPGYVKLQ